MWEQLTPLNADQGLRAGAAMQGTPLCTPEMNQGESQLLWVHVELNLILAPGFPSRDEMPALPQLDHCPAQGKSTPPCPSPCAFFVTANTLW